MQDRRNFLKALGIGSAVVSGAKGEPEKLVLPAAEVEPPPQFASHRILRTPMHDVADGILYDQLVIDKNLLGPRSFRRQALTFFDNVGSASGKTYAETNMARDCQLDNPEIIAVKKLGVTFSPTVHETLRSAVIQRYSFHLWVGQKCYFNAPLVELFTDTSDDPKAALRGLHTLEIPILLTWENTFFCQLMGRGLSGSHSKVVLWATLRGPRGRGVQ